VIPCILRLSFYSRAGWCGRKALDFYREVLVRMSDETLAVLPCFNWDFPQFQMEISG